MKKVNLISLSGKIGSGKNTVASIIQYLVWKNKLEKGEINTGLYDLELFLNSMSFGAGCSGWEQRAFAYKLKQIASILTGISPDKFEDQEFKKTELGEEWNLNGGVDAFEVRLLLQRLGTDAIRDIIHPNAWVNALFADYHGYTPKVADLTLFGEIYVHEKCSICGNRFYGYKRQYECADCVSKYAPFYPNWVITDCRFPNEFDAVKQRGGICIRVERPNTVLSTHASETALDNHQFDYTIQNKGTIDDLVIEVEKMLKHFKII